MAKKKSSRSKESRKRRRAQDRAQAEARREKEMELKIRLTENARKQEAKLDDGSESLQSKIEKIRQAFYKTYDRNGGPAEPIRHWVLDVFDKHVVVQDGDCKYKVPYGTDSNGEAVFETERSEWKKVEEVYTPVQESLHIVAASERADSKKGREWEIAIIGPDTPEDILREGEEVFIRSKNGRVYSTEALKNSVALFEGVKVYDNHLTDKEFEERQGMRSVSSEWVGVITKPRYSAAKHTVFGVLKVVDGALREKLLEAYEQDVINSIGLSIDVFGTQSERIINGTSQIVITGFDKANSVDVVADPAAGGRFKRLIASVNPTQEAEEMTLEEMLALLQEKMTEAVGPLKDELARQAAVIEALQAEPVSAEAAEEKPEEEPVKEAQAEAKLPAELETAIKKLITQANDAQKQATEATEKLQKKEAEQELTAALKESGLPADFQALIRKQFEGRVFESADLTGAIKAQKEALNRVTESGGVRIPEGSRISVGGMNSWDQYEMSLIRLIAGHGKFGEIVARAKENKGKSEYEQDPYAPQRFSEALNRYVEDGAPSIVVPTRLSEWYYDLAGGVDAAIDGRLANKRLIEAAVDTTSMSSIVKNALNLMIAAEYSARQRWWEPLVVQEDVDTLDDSTLVRTYGISDLVTMSEGDPYSELSWADDEETASFVKRGGYIGVTQETFLRDKLSQLKRIPKLLSDAWYNEIGSLVSAVFTTNTAAGPVLGDTGALFNATAVSTTGGHANLLTTALSHAGYGAAKLAMRKQTDEALGAGERLGITPRFLLVPADLEATAKAIMMSSLVPGQSGGATTGGSFQTRNVYEGDAEVIVVPNWTDTNDWALAADPAQYPAIYLIWLRGRRTPELFAANSEVAGAMFTNDTIRYKVRMYGQRFSSTYDCAPVADFRPLHKNNV